MFTIKIEAKFPGEAALNKFEEDLEVLLKVGLDDAIVKSIPALKLELKKLINQDIRNIQETIPESIENENINLPKADVDILEYLTDINITEINNIKKHKSSIDSETVIVQRDKRGGPLARLILDVGPGETIESQYAKARNFFNEALFVIPNRDGSVSYRINNGADLSKYIKIVCSTDTGITDNSEARLERFKQVGGKAEWTLKQNAFDKMIEHNNSGFIDIGPIITSVKNGNYQQAKNTLLRLAAKNLDKQTQFSNLVEKIDKLENNNDPNSNVALHHALIQLIDSITVSKKHTKTKTIYTLVTEGNVDEGSNKSFFSKFYSKLNLWVINYETKWFNSLVLKVKKLIKTYTG